MSHSIKSIPFFSDEIELDVHTATYAEDIRHMSIREFCDIHGQRVSLEQRNDNQEYRVRTAEGIFIEGQLRDLTQPRAR